MVNRTLSTGQHVGEATDDQLRTEVTLLYALGKRQAAAQLETYIDVKRSILGWIRTDLDTGEGVYRTRGGEAEIERRKAALKAAIDGLDEEFEVRRVEEAAWGGRPGFAIDKQKTPFKTAEE